MAAKPPWGFLKELAMLSLCPGLVCMTGKGERGLMSFAKPRPDSVRGDGAAREAQTLGWDIAGSVRVEVTMGAIIYMATLAKDDKQRMGREALRRAGVQWGRQAQEE